jgi:Mn-dependent DtxR family transcriptional regulator
MKVEAVVPQVKTEISLLAESDLEFLIKLQRKWEEITKTRKAGKTFFSGSLYLFIQNFPASYCTLQEISSQMQMLSPRTIEKHIECLTAVGILGKDESKRVALTLTGKKVAEVLHKYDQNFLEEQLLNRIEEIKFEERFCYHKKQVDAVSKFREKLCGHCKYRKVNKCIFNGYCERGASYFEFFCK